MSNIKPRPVAPIEQSETLTPKIHSPEFKHNLIDLDVTPPNSIVVNIQGYPVIGDWYNHRIGIDQEPDGFNSGQSTPHQAYRLIRNVKIKLNSPFDYSVNSDTVITDFTTTGKIYIPTFIPVTGDVFLMEIGNGRLGRFEVVSVRPLSIYQDRAYECEFRLMELATITVVEALNKKVVETLHYVEEFILSGQNPLLTNEQFNQRLTLKQLLSTVSKQYLANNYSKQHSTLLVPEQSLEVYDPWVTTCILNLIEHDAHPYMRKLRDLNVDGFQTRDYTDIYTVLLNCDVDSLAMCFTEAGMIDARKHSRNYSIASIRFSTIPKVMYPTTMNQGADRYYAPLSSGASDAEALALPIGNSAPTGQVSAIPTLSGRSYVFPESFYNRENVDQDMLTKLVEDYLEGKVIDATVLIGLCNQRTLWSSVERFYFEPILIILIKATLKGIGPW